MLKSTLQDTQVKGRISYLFNTLELNDETPFAELDVWRGLVMVSIAFLWHVGCCPEHRGISIVFFVFVQFSPHSCPVYFILLVLLRCKGLAKVGAGALPLAASSVLPIGLGNT